MWHKVSIIPIDDQGAIMENQKVYGMKRWTPILHEKKKKNSKKGQSKTFPFYTLLLPMFNWFLIKYFFLGNKIYFLQHRNVGGLYGSD